MSEHKTKTQANLVKMANQISLFFESQTPTEPAKSAQALAAHLKLFWAPPMRSRLVEQIQSGQTDGVNAIVVTAVKDHRRVLLNEHLHEGAEVAMWSPEGGGDAG